MGMDNDQRNESTPDASKSEYLRQVGRARMLGTTLGILGGAAGGAAGYFLFFWVVRQGIYAIILPGALMGIGCGLLSGRQSLYLGVACALSGLALGVFTEWRFAPFAADRSFSFFLLHLHHLPGIKLILLAFGGLVAFGMGMGRDRRAGRQRQSSSAAPHVLGG